MGINPEILTGCCSFLIERAGYFRRFNLVEVQQTLYQLPRVDTLRRWWADVPAGRRTVCSTTLRWPGTRNDSRH
jgi:hypothetical protein